MLEIRTPQFIAVLVKTAKQNMFLILYFINPSSVEWNTALGDFKLSHVTWRLSGSSEYVVITAASGGANGIIMKIPSTSYL
ncbi:hypothetical protein GQX74_000165 [Glossina fuscipes]|nr:hypothetical protein GQX74_000165 [Glossina fuscipes]